MLKVVFHILVMLCFLCVLKGIKNVDSLEVTVIFFFFFILLHTYKTIVSHDTCSVELVDFISSILGLSLCFKPCVTVFMCTETVTYFKNKNKWLKFFTIHEVQTST